LEDLRARYQLALANPDTPNNVYAQYLLALDVRALLPHLSTASQAQLFEQTLPVLSRTRQLPPEAARHTLQRILSLSKEEDIYDALRSQVTKAPAFPLVAGEELYPDDDSFLGRYVRWARWGNAPLGFHAWAGIAALGAAAQRRVFFPGAKRLYMPWYVILGGISSSGKGQALDPMVALLHAVNDKLAPTDVTRRINILPADSTMESMISMLSGALEAGGLEEQDDGRIQVRGPRKIDATGIIPLDELATFFGKDSWAVARKAPFLTTIKETDRYVKLTKRSGLEELENTAISLIGCVAPGWMRNTIDADLLSGGFMDRCVWLYRDPVWERREAFNILNTPPKDPVEMDFLADWIVERVLSQDRKVPALMDPAALDVANKLHRTLVDQEHRDFLKYGPDTAQTSSSRITGNLGQLATLLAMSDSSWPPIHVLPRHVELAYAILKAEETSLKEFMAEGASGTSVVNDHRLRDFIEEQGGCIPVSLLNRQFRRLGTPKQIRSMLEDLEGQALLEIIKLGGKRNGEVVRLGDHDACPRCRA
jgi:hypothetical protein